MYIYAPSKLHKEKFRELIRQGQRFQQIALVLHLFSPSNLIHGGCFDLYQILIKRSVLQRSCTLVFRIAFHP